MTGDKETVKMKVERHYLHGVGKNENVIKNKKDQD